MSSDPNCDVCDGAGWDWRRAADEDLQVDDPVDYYQCPCVEVMRLRAEIDKLAEENYKRYWNIERLRVAGHALAESLAEFHDPQDDLRLLAWREACREW